MSLKLNEDGGGRGHDMVVVTDGARCGRAEGAMRVFCFGVVHVVVENSFTCWCMYIVVMLHGRARGNTAQ